jgi:protein required for attachment to host cells
MEFEMKRLTRHGRVLVVDGARALVYRNEAVPPKLDLKLERGYSQENPPTHDQGTSVPGRVNDSMGRRSAMEGTDWHQIAEDKFMTRVAADMAADLAAGKYQQLIIVAPPVALGVLRKALSAPVHAATLLEIHKDLTKHPVHDIGVLVTKALEDASV